MSLYSTHPNCCVCNRSTYATAEHYLQCFVSLQIRLVNNIRYCYAIKPWMCDFWNEECWNTTIKKIVCFRCISGRLNKRNDVNELSVHQRALINARAGTECWMCVVEWTGRTYEICAVRNVGVELCAIYTAAIAHHV